MKKYKIFLLGISLLVLLSGCSVQKVNTEKIRDIEFTVLEEEKVPEEFLKVIRKKQQEPFKLTYADEKYLYIADGYGEMKSGGYSVSVDRCFETANAVYIHTNLLGPSKEETKGEKKTCPYVVIKLEFIDKNVVFE